MVPGMTISKTIAETFARARALEPVIDQKWRAASFRIGALLPNSLLVASVQKIGELDLVLRAMEIEHRAVAAGESPDSLAGHYLVWLSELWIGSAYEILRLLKDDKRRLVTSTALRDLEYLFRLLRVPLEKHEIAGDAKLASPLQMRTVPGGPPERSYTYDRRDKTRAHIMPCGITARGSVAWQAFDPAANGAIWLERQALSDQMIALWPPTSQDAGASGC